MAMSGGKDDGSPMMEMNTTPLIDVMLVLLIMFIITIPVATHSIDIDLPPPTPPVNPPPVNPLKNKVIVTTQNQVIWQAGGDGGPQQVVSFGELFALLKQAAAMPKQPQIQYQPDPYASYQLSANVMNVIKASKVTGFGFVGNEQFSEFDKAKK
jgi:biopolymer transport protein ExbD